MAVQKITEAEFQGKVLNSTEPVLVDFYADWCGPCKMLSPVVDEVSQEIANVNFFKLNVDEAMDTSMKYGITGIPCLIFFRNGQAVGRIVGTCEKEKILSLIGQ